MDRSTAETQRFGRGCLSRLSIDAAIPA